MNSMIGIYEATGLAAVGFMILLWITRSRKLLSLALFSLTVIGSVTVILCFTPHQLNNIVLIKDLTAQVLAYTMILLWLAHWNREDGFRFVSSPMNAPVLIFFAACILSAAAAHEEFRYAALKRLSVTAACVLTFWIVVNFFHTRRRWWTAVYTFISLLFVTIVYALLQRRGYDFMNWGGRTVIVSTFGNLSFFSSFLGYTTPLALYMALGSRRWIPRLVCLAFAALSVYELVQIKMRVGYLSLTLLGACVVYFELRFGRIRTWLRTRTLRRMGWAVAVALPLLFYSMHSEKIDRVLDFTFFGNEMFTSIRIMRMGGGLMMAWDRPMMGHGIGSYHTVLPYFRDGRYHRVGLSHNTDFSASQVVDLLCEQGILGLSAFLAVLAIFFICAHRHLRKIPRLQDRYIFFGVMASVFCGWIPDGMSVNCIWMTSMLTFWCLLALGARMMMCGMDETTGQETEGDANLAAPPDPFPEEAGMDAGSEYRFKLMDIPVYAFVVGAFSFMVWAECRVTYGDWLLNRCEESGGNEAGPVCEESISVQPYSHSAYYKLGFHAINGGRLDESLKAYHRLLAIAPNYAQTHQNTGLIYYRKFQDTNRKAYLYQSILEFEWATILENNPENQTKMLQLYAQMMNNLSRGLYHNQFIFRDVQEDRFLNTWRYEQCDASDSAARAAAYNEWIKPLQESSKDYWLFRIDSDRRRGRPSVVLKYEKRMAVAYDPSNIPLREFIP